MAPEKRTIQSFFTPAAKKAKPAEAEPPNAPVSNSPAKSPRGTIASKSPGKAQAPVEDDGLSDAQRSRIELNKQIASAINAAGGRAVGISGNCLIGNAWILRLQDR